MTVINEMDEYDERDAEDVHNDEPYIYFYVEKATGQIYEVQMFSNFVLIRSATPEFRSGSLRKISNAVFEVAFEEYQGDNQHLRNIQQGYDYTLIATRR